MPQLEQQIENASALRASKQFPEALAVYRDLFHSTVATHPRYHIRSSSGILRCLLAMGDQDAALEVNMQLEVWADSTLAETDTMWLFVLNHRARDFRHVGHYETRTTVLKKCLGLIAQYFTVPLPAHWLHCWQLVLTLG